MSPTKRDLQEVIGKTEKTLLGKIEGGIQSVRKDVQEAEQRLKGDFATAIAQQNQFMARTIDDAMHQAYKSAYEQCPKRNLDLLLWAASVRPDIAPRKYTDEDIAAFSDADRLDENAQAVVRRFQTSG